MLRFDCHTCGLCYGMRGNHHNLPRYTNELLLYTPPRPFSNPLTFFSLFFLKIFVKTETFRKYYLVLPFSRTDANHRFYEPNATTRSMTGMEIGIRITSPTTADGNHRTFQQITPNDGDPLDSPPP